MMQPRQEGIASLIERARRRLAEAGIGEPRREARLLLAHALGGRPGALPKTLEPAVRLAFEAALERRAGREPLAYITGMQGFWTLDLAVSDATLIPRADSETLIESLLRLYPARGAALRMLDLGTGSGCLLLACLSEYPQAWGLGIDKAEAACRLAAGNACRCRLAARCAFLCANWAEPLGAACFDVVLSNPPYIRAADVLGLMPEVAHYEPRLALDGGEDGLVAYRAILSRLPALLNEQGVAILELGAGQLEAVRAIAEASGLAVLGVHADLSEIPRVIMLRRL